MEYVLISNDTTKLTYWRLKEPEACWEEEQKRNLSYSLSSQHSVLVIDMKSKYINKTREQIAVTLLEELTQNQTNNHDAFELSRRLECISLSSSN